MSRLRAAVQQAATRRREDCLPPREKERQHQDPLVVTYHPSLPLLRNITRQHQHLLQLSERMQKAVPAPPIIAYRCPKNLRDLLTRAELKPPPQLVSGIWKTQMQDMSHTNGHRQVYQQDLREELQYEEFRHLQDRQPHLPHPVQEMRLPIRGRDRAGIE